MRRCPDGDFLTIFFASCIFSEPRAAHFRHAFEIRTKATSSVEVGLGIRRGKNKKETTGRKYNVCIYAGLPELGLMSVVGYVTLFTRQVITEEFSQCSDDVS